MSEWMLTENEMDEVWESDTTGDFDINICKAQAKKLLEYLIAESKTTGAKITLGRFYEMLKQLEVKP